MTTQTKSLSNAGIARAALVVVVGFAASGALGFIRTAVLSAQFGTGEALDAFYTAQQLPEIIFTLVAGGALGSSFIPIYARYRELDAEQGWRLASAVTTLAALVAGLLGLLVALGADWIVSALLLTESDPAVQALTADMTRLMMVTPFIFSISGLVMGILQSHGQFLLPSLAIGMNPLGIIIGALVIAPALAGNGGVDQVGNASIYGAAYGAILGAALHLIVQLPGLLAIKARLRVLPDLRVPGVLQVLALMGPRVLGVAVVQINFLVNIILTDQMVEGSLTALRTAFTLMFFALGVIGQSAGSAVFPSLAALHAENDMDGFKNRLTTAMRGVMFLAFPATVAFILLGEPLVSLFETGEWTATSTAAAAWALSFYALGITGFALLEVLSRAFYALADTWTPVLVGIGAMVSNIVLSLMLVQVMGDAGNLARGPFAGLALANAVTTLAESLLLWWLMRRRIGALGSQSGLKDADLLGSAGRALLASLVMGAALALLVTIFPDGDFGLAVLGAAVGGPIFFGVAALLGLSEARAVPVMIFKRLRRN